jgi:hypothetical protein
MKRRFFSVLLLKYSDVSLPRTDDESCPNGREDSLGAEGLDGIDRGGAARREIAGDEGCGDQA